MNAADFAMDGPDLSPDDLKRAVGGTHKEQKEEKYEYVFGAVDCRTRQVGGAFKITPYGWVPIGPAEATKIYFGKGGPGYHCCD